jgi:hypothetical protein
VIAPIDVPCPCCAARAGAPCTEWRPPDHREGTQLLFHHAARVDAAARSGAVVPARLDHAAHLSGMEQSRQAPHQELTDAEIGSLTIDHLRESNRALRAEAVWLVERIEHMRPVFDAAIDWRKHVTLIASEPLTQKVLDAIDAAIDAEEAAARST